VALFSAAVLTGAALSPVASAATSRPTTPHTGIFAAAGVRQWLSCRGQGPVTVVVVPGLHATASSWSKVSNRFSWITRVCFYDRPGLGLSPARSNRGAVLDAGGLARELQALLNVAHEPGPYVVVGHSFGGLVARAFIRQNYSRIAGVLLAESVDPKDTTLGQYWQEAGHNIDMVASQRAAGAGPRLGSHPLVVLSASKPDRDHLKGPTYGEPDWVTKLWINEQRENKNLSSNSIQVIAESGHVLQQDNPNAVVAALHAVVAAVESGRELHCTYDWSKVHADCRD